MRHHFKIFFYTKRTQMLKCGKVSIMCRISINSLTCAFSTHLAVEAKQWDRIRCRVRGRGEASRRINDSLDNISYTLYEHYQHLLRTGEEITPQAIRQAYWGKCDKSDGIIAFFRDHNVEFEKMVGTIRRPSTLYKYRYVCNHLEEFILTTFHVADIPLQKMSRDFIYRFHEWLITVRHCNINTVRTYLTAFKHIMMLAVRQGYIAKNPFLGYELRSESSNRSFLMLDEIYRLSLIPTLSDTETIVRDAFLFCCFTGLAYTDVVRLTMNDIIAEGRGCHLVIHRMKTHTAVKVPLLQKPLQILEKYQSSNKNYTIFPLPSNCWCNKLLENMVKRAEINKHVTFHAARHTFATTITLAHGVSIETVSHMLGHTDIKTTQIYAKVLGSTIDHEMLRVSNHLTPYFDGVRHISYSHTHP